MNVRPPSGHSPRPEDTPRTKGLKELRQKRLAYFETQPTQPVSPTNPDR